MGPSLSRAESTQKANVNILQQFSGMCNVTCENSLENTSGKGAGEENKSTRCLKVPINIMEKEYEIQDTELRQKERIY